MYITKQDSHFMVRASCTFNWFWLSTQINFYQGLVATYFLLSKHEQDYGYQWWIPVTFDILLNGILAGNLILAVILLCLALWNWTKILRPMHWIPQPRHAIMFLKLHEDHWSFSTLLMNSHWSLRILPAKFFMYLRHSFLQCVYVLLRGQRVRQLLSVLHCCVHHDLHFLVGLIDLDGLGFWSRDCGGIGGRLGSGHLRGDGGLLHCWCVTCWQKT